MEQIIIQEQYIMPTASQRKKATQNLEATQEMEMLMEHLFIQDLNLLGLCIKEQMLQEKVIGSYV
jgi:imidazoleglycerol phosphate synthase glutamine amidotransferase subunit HisH